MSQVMLYDVAKDCFGPVMEQLTYHRYDRLKQVPVLGINGAPVLLALIPRNVA